MTCAPSMVADKPEGRRLDGPGPFSYELRITALPRSQRLTPVSHGGTGRADSDNHVFRVRLDSELGRDGGGGLIPGQGCWWRVVPNRMTEARASESAQFSGRARAPAR